MSLKRKRDKDMDGTDTGEFDSLTVSGNALIQGNLTVDGTINGGGGGPISATYFEATDATNQFRTTQANVDLKANSATPVFNLKNNANATTASTLNLGTLNVQNASWTTNGNDIILSANNSSLYMRHTIGSINGQLELAQGFSRHYDASGNVVWTLDKSNDTVTQTGPLVVTDATQSNQYTQGAVLVTGGIGAGGNIHSNGQIHAQATTESNNTTTGAMVTSGGIGVAKNINVGGNVAIKNTSLESTGNDLTIGASTDTIRLRPNKNNNHGEIEHSATQTIIKNTSGTACVTVNKSTGAITTTDGITAAGAILADSVSASGNLLGGAIVSTAPGVLNGGTYGGSSVLFSADSTIGHNTTDGSDTRFTALTGGGANGSTRGGRVVVSGNERATNAGQVQILAGGSGSIVFGTNGDTTRGTVNSDGTWSIGGPPNLGSSGSFRVLRLSPFSGDGTQITFDKSTGTGTGQNYIFSNTSVIELGGSPVYVNNPTAATSVSTGAFRVLGGISNFGSIVTGGSLTIGNNGGTYMAGSIFSNSAWGMIFRAAQLAPTNEDFMFANSADTQLMYLSQGRVRLLTQTTASTSSTTGGLQIPGGLGISNTTNSVSSTNGGGLTCAGGAAFARDVRLGGWLYVGNASWSTNGNDIFLNANNSSIFLRPSGGAGELEVGTTLTRMRDTGSNVIWTLDKSANTVTQSGPLIITNNTQATSTTTGALRVTGGMSCQGNLHVGGTITGGSVSYGSTTSGTFTVTNGTGQTFVVDSTEASTTPTTGAARIKGGLGVEGNLNVGGTITGGSITYGSTSTGTLAVTNGSGTTLTVASTTGSTTPTSGAVTIAGGLGVNENLFVAGRGETGTTFRVLGLSNPTSGSGVEVFYETGSNTGYLWAYNRTGGAQRALNVNNALTFTAAGVASFLNTTDATASNVGSVVLAGGLAISDTADAATTTNGGSITTAGGLAVAKKVFAGDKLTVTAGGADIAGALNLTTGTGQTLLVSSTQTSTSTTTGSVRINGGVGIAGTVWTGDKLNVTAGGADIAGALNLTTVTGQNLVVSSTQASTSTTTGCSRFNGGIGVAGAVWTGGVVRSETEVAVERSGAAEMRVYNQGAVTEWVMGQRSGADHNFKITSKVGASYSTCAEINTSGQLKLGTGSFFGYEEGIFTVSMFRATGGTGAFTITSQNCYYVKVGKQVSCSISVNFSVDSGSGIVGMQDICPIGTPLIIPAVFLNMGDSELPGLAKPYFLSERALITDGRVYVTGYNDATWNPGSTTGCSLAGTYTYIVS